MRNYKKKNGKYKSYDQETMEKAVNDVRNGLITVRRASTVFNINRTTLLNHVKNDHCGKVGAPQTLSMDEESLLVHAIVKLAEWGFGQDRRDILMIAESFLEISGKHSRNRKLGIDWMRGFEKRGQETISRRVGQNLPLNRAKQCNQSVVEDFFSKLDSAVKRLGLENSPANIFNVDETGFQTDCGKQKLLCRKGLKNPHKIVGTTTKAMYTVQECCSADGKFLSPYIVYKGKHLYSGWCSGGPENCRYNVSLSGWMESDQFKDWFFTVFVEETKLIRGPKLLIMDGHNSHISLPVIDKAIERDIELLCLPAHTSDILQPLDVGVYKSVKSTWRKVLSNHYADTRHQSVDKATFPSLLRKVHESDCMSRQNGISGFEASGIYPFNPGKVLPKLAPSLPFQSETSAEHSLTQEPSTSAATDPSTPLPMAAETEKSATHVATVATTPAKTPEIGTGFASKLTPRSSLEKAILNHLNFRENPKSTKKSRIRRSLAESLTDKDVRDRIEAEQKQRESKQKNNGKGRKRPLKTKETNACTGNKRSKVVDDKHGDLETLDEDSDCLEEPEIDSSSDEAAPTSTVRCGQWVLIKFSVGKANKAVFYVGQVCEINDEGQPCSVTFLRKVKESDFFVWPEREDIMSVETVQIEKVLREPTIDRRHRLAFSESFENLNVM